MHTPESLTQQSGHLAWCALVALNLARHDGRLQSEAQENLFIVRWLADAQKQRRFPRAVAHDINWLLKQGRQLGVRARLREKLDYLWQSCSGSIAEQNDLFRLTSALEAAKSMGWDNRILNGREWSDSKALPASAGVSVLRVSRSSLDAAFDDDGGQIRPLMARLTGNITGLTTLLAHCGWEISPAEDEKISALYTFTAKSKDSQTPAADAEQESEK